MKVVIYLLKPLLFARCSESENVNYWILYMSCVMYTLHVAQTLMPFRLPITQWRLSCRVVQTPPAGRRRRSGRSGCAMPGSGWRPRGSASSRSWRSSSGSRRKTGSVSSRWGGTASRSCVAARPSEGSPWRTGADSRRSRRGWVNTSHTLPKYR